jgi:hypothetical protein
MISFIGYTLGFLALAWDGLSLVLNLKRNLKGYGPSGVPVISLLVYFILTEHTDLLASIPRAGLVLFFIHLSCHFFIPWLHKLILWLLAKCG